MVQYRFFTKPAELLYSQAMNRIDQFRSGIQEITADFGKDQVRVLAADTELVFQSGPDYDLVQYGASLPGLSRDVTIKLVGANEGKEAHLTRLLDMKTEEWIEYARLYDRIPNFAGVYITDRYLQAEALNIVRRPLSSRASRLAIASLTNDERMLLLERRLIPS